MPDICPTLLLEFIQTAGSEMWRKYRSQFKKLLTLMHQQYIPQLEKVSVSNIIDVAQSTQQYVLIFFFRLTPAVRRLGWRVR